MDSELVLGKIDEPFELPSDEISPRGGTGLKNIAMQGVSTPLHGGIE